VFLSPSTSASALSSQSRVMSRRVIIDDANPSIQYSGPWFEVDDSQLNTGAFGNPFQNTLHGVNVNANFSFPFSGMSRLLYCLLSSSLRVTLSSFSGSQVFVYGTTNASGTQDPTWECFIDNTSIGSNSASNISENNWTLCGGGLQDGPHLLTVKANVSNQQQTFWFDQIQYAPSASVSLNQSLLRIDPRDSAIQYSSEWQHINYNGVDDTGNSSYTDTNGAVLTYQFSGS
jgi:hypothetical protein